MDPLQARVRISLWNIIYGVLNDWTSGMPLIITSAVLLTLFPIFSRYKQNALLLLIIFAAPIGTLYLVCRSLNINHFITSRYFINFLPLFFVSIYLSLYEIEVRFEGLRKFFRLRLFFVIFFIGSNIIMLPLYYKSEKQDFKGLVSYLSEHLKRGDKIFVAEMGYMPGILHYFGVRPDGRHYTISFRKIEGGKTEYRKSFIFRNWTFAICHSKKCCGQYITDGGRLWIIAGKGTAKRIQEKSPCVLKGYFDGSFLNFDRFPTDASMYLFLWDPNSPAEKGIDMPIE
jgi:hypothetical protein